MPQIVQFLAQMNNPPLEGRPSLTAAVGTSGLTWIIAAILTAGILLITFKTSKRNHLDRD
jgi:hypothetical protein